MRVFLNYGFLKVDAQQWDYWVIWQFYSQFLKEYPFCSPQWLYQFTFPLKVQEGSLFSMPLQHILFLDFFFFYDILSGRCEVMHHCSFVLHFLLFSAGEHLSFASGPSKRASCPTQAQQLWHTGLVAPKHVEYSWTRDQARVPGTVRWILHHWVTRLFIFFSF